MTQPDLWGAPIEIGRSYSSFDTNTSKVSTTVLRDGWIVVTWRDMLHHNIRGQILNADGTPFGESFDIGAPGSSAQYAPPVSTAALPNGRFLVAYEAYNPDTKVYSLVQRTFDVFGGAIDENVLALSSKPLNPSLSTFADGSFNITY